MNQLFDNICRILATPMPRSLALKLIFGGLVGAALAPFAFGDSCTGMRDQRQPRARMLSGWANMLPT